MVVDVDQRLYDRGRCRASYPSLISTRICYYYHRVRFEMQIWKSKTVNGCHKCSANLVWSKLLNGTCELEVYYCKLAISSVTFVCRVTGYSFTKKCYWIIVWSTRRICVQGLIFQINKFSENFRTITMSL